MDTSHKIMRIINFMDTSHKIMRIILFPVIYRLVIYECFMSHFPFSHSFPVTDIEQDFGSEKARVRGGSPGGGGWPQGKIAGGDEAGQ
jgi:hypothetical protein